MTNIPLGSGRIKVNICILHQQAWERGWPYLWKKKKLYLWGLHVAQLVSTKIQHSYRDKPFVEEEEMSVLLPIVASMDQNAMHTLPVTSFIDSTAYRKSLTKVKVKRKTDAESAQNYKSKTAKYHWISPGKSSIWAGISTGRECEHGWGRLRGEEWGVKSGALLEAPWISLC